VELHVTSSPKKLTCFSFSRVLSFTFNSSTINHHPPPSSYRCAHHHQHNDRRRCSCRYRSSSRSSLSSSDWQHCKSQNRRRSDAVWFVYWLAHLRHQRLWKSSPRFRRRFAQYYGSSKCKQSRFGEGIIFKNETHGRCRILRFVYNFLNLLS